MKVQVGDLLEDAGDGDIGLVVRFSRTQGDPYLLQSSRAVAMVLWATLAHPIEMDTTAVDSGWVRIISRNE